MANAVLIDVDTDVVSQPAARHPITIGHDHMCALLLWNWRPTRWATSVLMKLCVDPESRRAVNSWFPTDRRICIMSLVWMPVIVLRDIKGGWSSGSGYSVDAMSSASKSLTSR